MEKDKTVKKETTAKAEAVAEVKAEPAAEAKVEAVVEAKTEAEAPINPFASTVRYEVDPKAKVYNTAPTGQSTSTVDINAVSFSSVKTAQPPKAKTAADYIDNKNDTGDIILNTGKKSKQTSNVLIIILASIAAVALVATIVVLLVMNNGKGDNKNTTPAQVATSAGCDTPAEELDKDTALLCYKEYIKDVNFGVKRFTDDENLQLVDGEHQLILLESYENESEIPEIAKNAIHRFFSGEDQENQNFDIITNKYYSVVTPKKETENCDSVVGCVKGIAFNKKYLDTSEGKVVFKKTSDYFVDMALLMLFGLVNRNLSADAGEYPYSYSIEKEDDKYIFTIFNIGLSMAGIYDIDSGSDHNAVLEDEGDTAENLYLYETVLVLDTKTGMFEETDYDDILKSPIYERTEVLKVFPLTEEELSEIDEILEQKSDNPEMHRYYADSE